MHAQTSPDGGTFAGVVIDTAGQPLRDVQILIPDIGVSTRTDSAGGFTLLGVKPGRYEVWFRKVGLIVVQFAWESRPTARLEVRVKMRPLPNTLDPVRVYASEERTMTARSMVSGIVSDSAGIPLPGVQVQLIGAQRSTVTADDGTFVFRHVAPGPMVVRARQLGFSAVSRRFTLEDNDTREFQLLLEPLAQLLDEVRITAESGFDVPTQVALRDFDERMRWMHMSGSTRFFGPERLRSLGGGTLAEVRDFPDAPACMFPGHGMPCSACVLVDGLRGFYRPITTFDINDYEAVEYYPPTRGVHGETEWTKTVYERMKSVHRDCAGASLGAHPAYFVLWTKASR